MDKEVEDVLKEIDEKIYTLTVKTKGIETHYDLLDHVQCYLRKKGLDARYYADNNYQEELVAIKKLYDGARNEKKS